MVLVGEPAMILAVKTTASTLELWLIVVVGVACLAFWLTMVVVIAGRHPQRGTGQAPLPPTSRRPAEPAEPVTAVTRDDLPRVPAQRAGEQYRVPAQRAGEPDRAMRHPGTGRTTATGAEIADLEAAAPAGRDRQV
jgi:hypothetical protein